MACHALSGLIHIVVPIFQGVALGWYVMPLWGYYLKMQIINRTTLNIMA